MRGERHPGDGGHGRRGRRRSAAGDSGDEEAREDRRYRVDGVDEGRGEAGQQPEQDAGQQCGRADRDGRGEGGERPVADTGEEVAAERVGTQRVCPGRGLESGAGVEGERVASQAEHDDREEHRAVDQGGAAWRGWLRTVRGVERAVTEGRADEEAGGEAREGSGESGQQDEGEGAGLEDGEVLGEGGLEGGAAEAGYVEDLLDGDGAAGEADHEQAEVGQQSGYAAAYGLAGRGPPGYAACGGGQCPGFGEGAGQQVVEHPAEQRARGQAEGEGGQHHPLWPVPADRGQPVEVHADDDGEHGRGEELGQRGEHRGRAAAAAPVVEAAACAQPQGAGADRRGRDRRHDECGGHQQQRDAEGLDDGRGDLGAGDPRAARVTVRQPAEPLPQELRRARVEAEFVPYGRQYLRRGVAFGRARLEDRERRVGARQPRQQTDAAQQGDGEQDAPE